MQSVFARYAAMGSLLIEAAAVLLIVASAAEAFVGALRAIFGRTGQSGFREVFLRFGSRLILGLEFALAADIVNTAIAPTWNDIGQLAAVAAIRTFLNYFLERDITRFASASDRRAD